MLNPPPPQEIFDNDHRVVSQRGSSAGRFTFSAADSGDHKVCFTPSSSSGSTGWLSTKNHNGGIRLTLDLVIGETNEIESSDKSKIQDITTRVKDLNARLNDVRREQVFQRVSDTPPDNTIAKQILINLLGARGRVPRSVRVHKRPCRPLDHHPAHRLGDHLHLATVTPPILLHQAKVDLKRNTLSPGGGWVLVPFGL